MPSLQKFVQGGGRSNSPQMGQPTKPDRRAIAANAKIPMKRTTLNHLASHQQTGLGHQQSSSRNNTSGEHQRPQRRESGQANDAQKRDPWDTDAESLDTTINQRPIVKVEDSQKGDSKQYAQEVKDEYSDDEDEEGDEKYEDEQDDEEGDEGGDEGEFESFTEDEMLLIANFGYREAPRDVQFQILQQIKKGQQPHDMFDGNNSCPTTTTGDDNFYYNLDEELEPPSGNYNDRGAISSSPQPLPARGKGALHVAERSIQRPPSAEETKNIMQRPTKIQQQAAQIRKHERSYTTTDAPRGSHTNTIPLLSSEPPTYSQVTREPISGQVANENTCQNPQPRVDRLPQRDARPTSGPSRFQPAKPVEPHVHNKQPTSERAKREPVLILRHAEEAPLRDPEPPVGDYDSAALSKMSYDELKNQDFDMDPRASPPVIPKEIEEKPLVERLQHVKKLGAEDQGKFFSSLLTAEWEDAGDWFLDQFSSVIRRAKEARQHKRKLAQEFEDEVEKRHQHVAKKQQQVEDAMNKMKTQGEGLMPKSPRTSKSPRPGQRLEGIDDGGRI